MTTLTDLAKVKAIFQQRAILAAMGVEPEQIEAPICDICGGDCDGGIECESGDGV